MVFGPKLVVETLMMYRARLKREIRTKWYHAHRALEPDAFSRLDDTPGPSPGDCIFTNVPVFRDARRAYWTLESGASSLGGQEAVAYDLLGHEFSHCYVPHPYEGRKRLDPRGSELTFLEAQERYSHPEPFLAAVGHSFRRTPGVKERLAVNSFTRVLRWQREPLEVFADLHAWLGHEIQRRDFHGNIVV